MPSPTTHLPEEDPGVRTVALGLISTLQKHHGTRLHRRVLPQTFAQVPPVQSEECQRHPQGLVAQPEGRSAGIQAQAHSTLAEYPLHRCTPGKACEIIATPQGCACGQGKVGVAYTPANCHLPAHPSASSQGDPHFPSEPQCSQRSAGTMGHYPRSTGLKASSQQLLIGLPGQGYPHPVPLRDTQLLLTLPTPRAQSSTPK